MTLGTAHKIRRAGDWTGPVVACVALDYEARFLRRKRLDCGAGNSVMVDLAQTVSVEDGDAFETNDGALIEVQAAPEPLLRVTGDLVRLAWHIGNRHTPCEVGDGCLLIRDDHVLAAMLAQLGAHIHKVDGPFRPEGGAYGHGRTMGHSHGHDHGHDHSHDRGHSHSHPHAPDHVDHSSVNENGVSDGHVHSNLNGKGDPST